MRLLLAVFAAGLLLTQTSALAQVNKVNALVFGTRVPTFRDDPSGGIPFRQAAGDNCIQVPVIAGSKLVVFSPSGGTFVTATGNLAWLWNSSGSEIQAFPHPAPISAVSFSPDGTYVAIAGGSSVKLWSVPSGSLKAEFPHDSYVRDLVVSGNGNYVATFTANGFNLWDARGGVSMSQNPQQGVGAIVFSPDSTQFLTLTGNTATLWRTADSQQVGNFGHQYPVRAAMFSPDGRHVICTTDQWAHLWDAKQFLQITQVAFSTTVR